jgi:hypothetical protein
MNDVIEMERRQAAVTTTGTTPSDLLRMAVEQGADIAKLEQLMALQERWEANQARKAFVSAMAEFKRNPPEILKDKHVAFKGTEYNHATLGGICSVVIDALAANGFSHRWETEQPDSGMIVVSCVLTHSLGHSESTTMKAPPDNSGSKNAIQSIGSAITYLQRYTLLAACGLATNEIQDDDGRGAGKRQEQPKQKHPLNESGFKRALESIKKQEYTLSEIEAAYALTEDQLKKARDVEASLDA